MARRRKNSFDGLIGLAVIGFAIWLFVNNSVALGPIIVTIVEIAVVILVGLLIRWYVRRWSALLRRRRIEQSILRKAHSVTQQQLAALVRRRAQLVQPDAYGKPRMENWEKEIGYFISGHLKPLLTPHEQAALPDHAEALAMTIESVVQAAAKDQPVLQAFAHDMKPAEFEAYCAEELRRDGWDARVTMQSRDQGVDVIAEKNYIRVVLQCKLYASPVGNKAVQEAAAGKAHEQAHYGIVVTNNRYTLAAEQLAATNGVLLLHYRDLQSLESILLDRPSATTPRSNFDRAKWTALLTHDPDIRMVADKLGLIGEKWVDKFAVTYLTVNDKNSLHSIVSAIIADARKEDEQRRSAR